MPSRIMPLLQQKTVKNGIWLYVLQFCNTVVPLLTLPYITRVLGTTGYGVFIIALNIWGYLQVVVEYGFALSATRQVALEEKEPLDTSRLFSAIIYSRLLLTAVCVAVSGVYVFLNRSNAEQCVCLAILMFGLLGSCFQLNWLFQGKQDMKYISLIGIVSRTMSVICIFCFVKSEQDLFLYSVLYVISPIVDGVLGVIIASKKYGARLVRVSFETIKDELKKGWYVFTTQISGKVFGAIGITFMGFFATKAEVGIYGAIQKVPNVILLIWLPISQVLYPVASQKFQESFVEGKKYVYGLRKRILPLFVVGSLLVAGFSKAIVLVLFGETYVANYYWMIPLLVWLLFGINNNFLGIQTLLASGHDKEYSRCFQIGVFCTVLFNFLLIIAFKGNGAAIAPALSEFVLTIMLSREIKKLEKSKELL